jgi:hypothetical protein
MVSLADQAVVVDGTLATADLQRLLETTGLTVVVRGKGGVPFDWLGTAGLALSQFSRGQDGHT